MQDNNLSKLPSILFSEFDEDCNEVILYPTEE